MCTKPTSVGIRARHQAADSASQCAGQAFSGAEIKPHTFHTTALPLAPWRVCAHSRTPASGLEVLGCAVLVDHCWAETAIRSLTYFFQPPYWLSIRLQLRYWCRGVPKWRYTLVRAVELRVGLGLLNQAERARAVCIFDHSTLPLVYFCTCASLPFLSW